MLVCYNIKVHQLPLLTRQLAKICNSFCGGDPQLIGFIRFGEPVPHGLSALTNRRNQGLDH